MIRNAFILNCIGISPKTVIHVGAGKGEDRELYFEIGCEKLIWIEASHKLYLKLKKRFPADVILNVYVTNDNQDLKRKMFSKFNDQKPTSNVLSNETPQRSLDEIFPGYSLPQPILLVIDTDGAEVDILSGGLALMRKVSYLVIEQHFHWDRGEWHREITHLCRNYGFKQTLSRANHTNDYEDVLWTRFNDARILLCKSLDYIFLVLKQLKHIIYFKHLSTTAFYCKKCNK